MTAFGRFRVSVGGFWNARFSGHIPERLTVPEELKNNAIERGTGRPT
jgi:hypothetical protein